MGKRKFEPGRAVEVLPPKDESGRYKSGRCGSGYRIGGRLVLTAAHLLDEVGSRCHIRSKQSFGQVEAEVVWKAKESDIALVKLPKRIAGCAGVMFGRLPEATEGEKLEFQMYGYPTWARTGRGENHSASGGRQIEGVIYLSDTSPDELIVLEAWRLPRERVSGTGSEWEGASGAAIVCDGLVIGVQKQHQNPDRSASLEATPLLGIYNDTDWCNLLQQHGISPEVAIARSYSYKRPTFKSTAIGSAIVSISLIAMRFAGLLQPLELAAYDFFIRTKLAFDNITDERIVLVTITNEELDNWGMTEVSDRKLKQILEKLITAKPFNVGLDIYRDKPHGDPNAPSEINNDYRALVEYLEENKVVNACHVGEASVPGSLPPSPHTRLGFANIVEDTMNNTLSVRRQLLWMPEDPSARCQVSRSLTYQLALDFLQQNHGIAEYRDPKDYIYLGDTLLEPVWSDTGGYRWIDDAGDQILLNYRYAPFNRFTATEILEELTPQRKAQIQDRIVLVGYDEAGAIDPQDILETPIGRLSGVELHGQMLSHILSITIDDEFAHPQLQSWSELEEVTWIILWIWVEGILISLAPSREILVAITGGAIVVGSVVCWVIFVVWGWWLPLLPSLLGIGLLPMITIGIIKYQHHQRG